MLCKSMDWFLPDRELHHERVKENLVVHFSYVYSQSVLQEYLKTALPIFLTIFPFYTPYTPGFLMFSGGIEKEYCSEMF